MKRVGSLHLQCPVTALGFIGPLLIAAQGNVLVLIDQKNGSTTYSETILPAQTIHGILQVDSQNGDYYFFVWGGRRGRFIRLQSEDHDGKTVVNTCSSLYSCQDWILNGATAPNSWSANNAAYGSLALVTGHNGLILLKTQRVDANSIIFDEVELSGATRTLLYCGRVLWISDNYILLAAGTALGEVIAWACFVDYIATTHCYKTNGSATMYSFDAHDGSVFGLDVLLLREDLGDISQVVLCSCSDDRTIRTWNITPRFKMAQRYAISCCEGNMDAPIAEMAHNDKPPSLLSNAWAHSSRIWHVKFLPTSKEKADVSDRILLSFGEDATLQKWMVQFGTAEGIKMKHLRTFSAHSGKNIWSYAIDLTDENSSYIATGGADGAIILTDTMEAGHHIEACSLDTESVGQKPILTSMLKLGDKTKTYCFLSSSKLLITTHLGRVLVGNIQEQGINVSPESSIFLFRDLGTFPEIRSYAIVRGVVGMGAAFVASSKGDVYCYHPDGTFEKMLTVEGKITGMFTSTLNLQSAIPEVSGSETEDNRTCRLLVAKLGKPNMVLMEFQLIGGNRLHKKLHVNLDAAQDSHVTSFSCFTWGSFSVLLIGFRSGEMGTYLLPDEGLVREQPTLAVQQAIHVSQCHLDAVTSMLARCSKTQADKLHVLTTGRDCQFAIHEITFGVKTTMKTVHKATIPLGPFIEGAFLRPRDQHLLFYGFKSTDFVIFDETEQQVISSVDCGGAHRVWAYQHTDHDGGTSTTGNFVWTRSGLLHSICLSDERSQVLRRGAHGREIKSCALSVFDCDSNRGISSQLVATAAEDTDIRLFECREVSGGLSIDSVGIIRKHNTGVQRLQFSAGGQYLFSCGGSEEFYAWRLRRVPFISVGTLCEATLPPISELPDLRIMDFQVLETNGSALHDPPTFEISMIFSDATIRIYQYSKSTGFQLHGMGSYGTSCLTQVVCIKPLFWTDLDHRDLVQPRSILTAGTDGHIMIWQRALLLKDQEFINESHSLRVYFRHKVHQNTIKCVERFAVPSQYQADDTQIIVSGGDDNALAITRIDSSSSDKQLNANSRNDGLAEEQANTGPKVNAASVVVARAHTASISSLKVIALEQERNMCRWEIATVGNDQRIKTWALAVNLNKDGADSIQLTRTGTRFTAVADVADTSLLPTSAQNKRGVDKNHLVVCGVGMEICELFEDLSCQLSNERH